MTLDYKIDDMEIERLPIAALIPYAQNMNAHSDAHVAEIVASMKQFGWTNPPLIDKDSVLVAGHGRVLAAQELGIDVIPCIRRDHWTEAQIRAYRIADNRLARNATVRTEALSAELLELRAAEFDLQLLGFESEELKALLDPEAGSSGGGGAADDLSAYSMKIKAPIYEPKGERPPVESLFDLERTADLLAEIDAARGIPDEVTHFLRYAAARHTVFNYERIAEFYCHATKEVQNLMERSALVIIDFDKAIENGFVVLSEKLAEAYNGAED